VAAAVRYRIKHAGTVDASPGSEQAIGETAGGISIGRLSLDLGRDRHIFPVWKRWLYIPVVLCCLR
jgi:hypothetical protein